MSQGAVYITSSGERAITFRLHHRRTYLHASTEWAQKLCAFLLPDYGADPECFLNHNSALLENEIVLEIFELATTAC